MNKLSALVQHIPARLAAVVAMVAAAIIVPLALNAWGPQRPEYTIANPAPHVVFNSIKDNPDIGHEFNFVGIREATAPNVWHDDMNVENGKEYIVRMYVHNNAAENLGLVAENVTAKFNLPTTTAKSIQVNGFLSASNIGANGTNPGAYGEVYDHATFHSDRNFNVALVPGSIKYENNKGTFNLPESILTSTGAKLGYEKMDGKIPGCFKYDGYVTFKVKAQVQEQLNFDIEKTVRKSGETEFKDNVKVSPGDKVDFQIHFNNTGESLLNKVVIRDLLPEGMTYVPGTTWLHNTNGTRQVADGVTTSGIEIGNYGKGGGAYVKFTAQVAANDKLPACGTNNLKNVARAITEGYQKDDDATVIVDRYCKPEPPKPKYACDQLTVKKIDRTKFEFSTTYTVENATFKHVTYVVRDAAGSEVYRGTNNTFTATTPGNYTVQAYVTVTVNGEDKVVTSDNCKKSFKVEKPPVEKIKVCDLKTKQIIEINESDFDSSKHSKNLADCRERPPVEKIKVCDLETKRIITINKDDFDATKHSTNLDDCKEVPAPEKIEVCDLDSKTIITINKDDFDSSKHTTTLADCEDNPEVPEVPETPTTPEVPSELPETGVDDSIMALISLGSLVASISYYTISRRTLGA